MNDSISGVVPRKGEIPATTQSPPSADRPHEEQQTQLRPAAIRGTPQTQEVAKQKAPVEKEITLEELAEQLRKINLTFDLFEIEAKFSISEEDNIIRVELRNTRTGKLIRKIPPYEFNANYDSFKSGVGLLFNRAF